MVEVLRPEVALDLAPEDIVVVSDSAGINESRDALLGDLIDRLEL